MNSMKLRYFFGPLVVLVLACGTASGEIYQYTDESGVTRFTDDPSLIPARQRDKAKTIKSVKSDSGPKALDRKSTDPQVNTPAGEARDKVRELNAMRDELNKEYNALQAKKEALKVSPSQTAGSGERAAYNKSVSELNQRIDAYQQRVREFEQEVEAFDSRIHGK